MNGNDAKTQDFLRAVETHSGLINKVCYYYARDPEEFGDLRQEALIHLWQGWEQFGGRAQLSTWIYRVCLNSCVSSFRAHSRRHQAVSLDAVPDIEAPPDADRADQLRQMHRLIGRLAPREKAVILLWLDNYPYDTIAEMMGVPRNTVASWLKRIKEKIVRLSDS